MGMSDADRELMELQRSVAVQGHTAGLPGGEAAADPEAITTFEARRAAQREAYGQFVALEPITIGNAPVFVPGQQVPLEHVIRFGLLDQELVARVATKEQARVGKAFASDDEFHQANPHVRRRQARRPELHPSALDPRGGAAHLDTDGAHGPVVGGDVQAPLTAEQRDEKAGDVASKIVEAGAAGDEKPDDGKSTRSGRSGSGKAGN